MMHVAKDSRRDRSLQQSVDWTVTVTVAVDSGQRGGRGNN